MSSSIEIKENEVDKTVLARYSCNKFSEKQLEEGLLEYILKLTQRTPTAFNLQGYKIVTVKNPDIIAQVREAQVSANISKSLNAIPVIFLSDLQPSDSLPEFTELCKKDDLPDSFIKSVKDFLAYFIKEHWYDSYKTPVAGIARSKMNLPSSMDSFTYGEKTVGLVVSTFITLCTAHGIDTHVMESFADWKLQKILKIPSRFHPSLIVWCGYCDEEPKKMNSRYNSKDVLFEDSFGNPLKIPEELN